MNKKKTTTIIIWVLAGIFLFLTSAQMLNIIFVIKDYYTIDTSYLHPIEQSSMAGELSFIIISEVFRLALAAIPLVICVSYIIKNQKKKEGDNTSSSSKSIN